jgi:hypothetical protein
MASIASSELTSAPATSILEMPDDLQRKSDFGTTAAIASVPKTAPTLGGYAGIAWEQIPGWRIPSNHKKVRTWVVRNGHGWRLKKEADGTHWWHCKVCHKGKKLRTSVFKLDRASSASINHLKIEHRLEEHEPVQKKRRIGDGAMKSYVQSGSNPVNAAQNEQALKFDTATFKTLLYE